MVVSHEKFLAELPNSESVAVIGATWKCNILWGDLGGITKSYYELSKGRDAGEVLLQSTPNHLPLYQGQSLMLLIPRHPCLTWPYNSLLTCLCNLHCVDKHSPALDSNSHTSNIGGRVASKEAKRGPMRLWCPKLFSNWAILWWPPVGCQHIVPVHYIINVPS